MKVSDSMVLDIKITNAKVNIESYPPKLNVRTVKAEMKIERQAPSFKKVRVRKAAALRKIQPRRIRKAEIQSFVKDTVKYISADKKSGRVHRLENNISKYPPTADPLSGINAAIQETDTDDTHVVWDPGAVKTTWTQPRTILEWDIRRPKVTVDPHSVEVRVRRQKRMRFAPKPPAANRFDKKA